MSCFNQLHYNAHATLVTISDYTEEDAFWESLNTASVSMYQPPALYDRPTTGPPPEPSLRPGPLDEQPSSDSPAVEREPTPPVISPQIPEPPVEGYSDFYEQTLCTTEPRCTNDLLVAISDGLTPEEALVFLRILTSASLSMNCSEQGISPPLPGSVCEELKISMVNLLSAGGPCARIICTTLNNNSTDNTGRTSVQEAVRPVSVGITEDGTRRLQDTCRSKTECDVCSKTCDSKGKPKVGTLEKYTGKLLGKLFSTAIIAVLLIPGLIAKAVAALITLILKAAIDTYFENFCDGCAASCPDLIAVNACVPGNCCPPRAPCNDCNRLRTGCEKGYQVCYAVPCQLRPQGLQCQCSSDCCWCSSFVIKDSGIKCAYTQCV